MVKQDNVVRVLTSTSSGAISRYHLPRTPECMKWREYSTISVVLFLRNPLGHWCISKRAMVRQKHWSGSPRNMSSCVIDLIGYSLHVDNEDTREVLAADRPPRNATYMLKARCIRAGFLQGKAWPLPETWPMSQWITSIRLHRCHTVDRAEGNLSFLCWGMEEW